MSKTGLVKTALLSLRNQGISHTMKTTQNWMFNPASRSSNKLNPRMRYDNVYELMKKVDFTRQYEFGNREDRINDEYIYANWIVPPFHVGSGGHQTIFRYMRNLETKGFRNRVYITDGHNFGSPEEAYEMINNHFMDLPRIEVHFLNEDDVISGTHGMKDCDVLFATRYNTAYYAALIDNCMLRFYFVQDLEHLFVPLGSSSMIAENTYKLGIPAICASPWLAKKMGEYGLDATSFYLGYDPEVYMEIADEREENSVAFYARYQSERRAVEMGMLALELLQKEMPELKVYLYGANDVLQGFELKAKNLGVLSYDQINELFNTTKVGLTFSLTNYGLTPTEMMATGLPVVELKGDNTESIFEDGHNVILAQSNPRDIADKIRHLLQDEQTWEKIHDGGLAFADDKTWSHVFNESVGWILEKVPGRS